MSIARRLLTGPVIGWSVVGALALGIASIAVETTLAATLYGVPVAATFVLAVLHSAAIPLALIRPLAAAAASGLGVTLWAFATAETTGAPWPWPVAVLVTHSIALALIGIRARPGIGILAWLAAILGTIGVSFAFPHVGDAASISVIIATSVSGAALGLGIAVREWRDIRDQLLQAKRESASEHERRVLAEEKARIARELHDVVAHSMSVITVQASSAPYRHEGVTPAVAAEFDDIANATRTALDELRGLLGVLRNDSDQGERAPQPRFADIPSLVQSTERSGIDLAFQWSGSDVGEVSDVAGLAAYRIVQEALSNAIRHAPGAPVFVEVAHDKGAIEISVVNTAPPVAPALGEPGHGIVGMRERVASVGGSLETAPTSDGGFALRARIPLRRMS